jgi:hypothetical protein
MSACVIVGNIWSRRALSIGSADWDMVFLQQ